MGKRVPRQTPFELQHHSALTYEGAIEGVGRFTSNVTKQGGARKWAARAVAVAFIAPFVWDMIVQLRELISG